MNKSLHMSVTDIDELLQEATTSPPCGPEMTYAPEFLALEQAARGKVEQQYGDTIIPAEEPEWPAVESNAVQLLLQSKDMRIAGLLCRSWTNTSGLQGLARGLDLMAALLERYWDLVHPMAEEDDYFMRMNAIAILNDVSGLLRELRQTELFKSTFGQFTVRDSEVLARGQRAESNPQLTAEQLRMGLDDAVRREDPHLMALPRARTALQKIQQICADKLPHHQHPDLGNIQSLLALLAGLLPSRSAPLAHPAPGEEASAAPAALPPRNDALEIRTRDDAIRQLVRIAEFLESTEPTNPASLLIRRSARLMGMGFMDILRELAPQSLQQIEVITGTTSDSTG
ncbi:type VI secretion system protein TssA [Paracidovorax sp. MALMAid1276]|uniref:type VI secretion system protein TssA n=1 Tax=Paracidovorax sp. MALMAid1276 TaxID=3411631 RepID=UPI003B9B5C9A